MKTCSTRTLILSCSATSLFVALLPSQAAAVRRSKSDRDINAIGHREIVHGDARKFISSPEKERQLGAQYLAVFEHSAKLIKDPEITGYLSDLAEKIGRNSDAHTPIRVVILDTNTVNACTSPGGYQYLTRGLLVHAQSESELAAVLAHGVAKTALH